MMVQCYFSAPVVLICTVHSPAQPTVADSSMSENTGAGQLSLFVITDIHDAFSLSGHISGN
jgi:hypothetical protein